MAKATATCTCATCGKTFEVIAYKSNSRGARSFEAWAAENITECRECADKRIAQKRADDSASAMTEATENGWPALTGSEKQIAWAASIRKSLIDENAERYTRPELVRLFSICVEELVNAHTTASWWIDHREGIMVRHSIQRRIRELKADPDSAVEKRVEKAAEEEAKADEATIAVPNDRRHAGVADIKVVEDRVSAAYVKDEDFRALVKELGYSWDAGSAAWNLKITATTDTAEERAAELGNRLLNAGFAIRIQDAETLRRAVSGDYEPMTYRWICRRNGTDQFFIRWGRDDDLYSQAKRLPGARYDKPGVLVPGSEYTAVLDFADVHGFRLTVGAKELLEEMRATTTTVTPAPVKKPEYNEHPLDDVLNSSRDIIDDLKEEVTMKFTTVNDDLFAAQKLGYRFDPNAEMVIDQNVAAIVNAEHDGHGNHLSNLIDRFCDFDSPLYRGEDGEFYAMRTYYTSGGEQLPLVWRKLIHD